jgi:hypothetical protein
VGLIWWIVSAILALAPAQKVHAGRATIAILAFPVLMGVLSAIGYVAAMAMVFSSMQRFANTSTAPAPLSGYSEASIVTQELFDGLQRNGAWPDHGLKLVTEGGMMATDFITSDSDTLEDDVPVGQGTLDDFLQLPDGRQAIAAQAAADALPPDVIAHRIGDFVFTYHGIPPGNPDPGLWIVILSEDPDINPPRWANNARLVGHADGSVQFIQPPWQQALNAQNALRAANGLPPLPDPDTVTHGSPATGAATAAP